MSCISTLDCFNLLGESIKSPLRVKDDATSRKTFNFVAFLWKFIVQCGMIMTWEMEWL